MRALTEKVAREHRPYRDPVAPGRLWLCGCDQGETSRDIVAHVWHVAEVTEAATRAAVAAEIREQRFIDADPDWNRSSDEAAFDDALAFASRIAEGKQP